MTRNFVFQFIACALISGCSDKPDVLGGTSGIQTPSVPPPATTSIPEADGGMPAMTVEAGPAVTPYSPSACPTGLKTAPAPTNPLALLEALSFEKLGSVDANLLTVAWVDAFGTVRVSRRSDLVSDFAPAERVVSVLSGGLVFPKVALLRDGKTLLAPDGANLVTHVKKQGAWVPSSMDAGLAEVHAYLADGKADGIDGLVASSSGKSLVFRMKRAIPTLREWTWSEATSRFVLGRDLDLPAPCSVATCRPTGMSFDDRTLFVWDETKETLRVVTRKAPSSPWSETSGELGPFPEATPNQNCSKFAYEATGLTGRYAAIGTIAK